MPTTYDTYFELLPAEEQSVQTGTFTFGYNKHLAIAGFQKLINKWVKSFMTLQGTDLSDRDYGTPFTSLIGSNITDRTDIQQICHTSVSKASQDIRRVQAQFPPDDETEILHSARLTSIVFETRSSIAVHVLIQNQAGRRLELILAGQVGTNG